MNGALVKFDQDIQLIQTTSVPNDIGGYEKADVLVATVKGLITTDETNLQIVNEQLVTVTKIKMFTEAKLPNFLDYVICDGIKYKVLTQTDLHKMRLVHLEKVS